MFLMLHIHCFILVELLDSFIWSIFFSSVSGVFIRMVG